MEPITDLPRSQTSHPSKYSSTSLSPLSSSSSSSSSSSAPPPSSSPPSPSPLSPPWWSATSPFRPVVSPMVLHRVTFTFTFLFILMYSATLLHAQTEGDTGYDYNDSYEEYDEESVLGAEPNFDVPIVNVTVVAGQTAVLPCSVEGIKGHKTTWVDPGLVPLTFENRRVVDDTRFSVIQPSTKEWNLQIRDITYLDRGEYRCTINTNPVKSKLVSLHVKVPASINHELSTSDLTAQEGETAVLVCNVSGVPTPDVTWYKWAKFAREEEKIRMANSGEVLMIRNVTRQCDAEYECVAYNGVPPPVSKRIKLTVHFAPTVHIATTRLGQSLGKETILDCTATALPHAIIHWEKEGNKISGAGRYIVEPYEEGDHKMVLSLRIRDLTRDDYGVYHCVASNSLGFHNGSMLLYEYPEERKTTSLSRNRPFFNHSPSRIPSQHLSRSTHFPGTLHRHSNHSSFEYPQHVKHHFRDSDDLTSYFERNVYAPIRGKFTNNGCFAEALKLFQFLSPFVLLNTRT